MTLQEIYRQVLELPINERWQLVQSVLTSIQQKTQVYLPNRFSEDISNEQVSGVRIVQERKPGLYPGAFVVHDDFDQPLPDAFWLGEE